MKLPFTHQQNEEGFIMPTLISLIVVIGILTLACLITVESNLSSVTTNIQSQKAFNIAEAGINYYLWHLSHSPADYKDGKSTPATPDPKLGYGPYVHNYIDDNAVNEGSFTLWINPAINSTSVTVTSMGLSDRGLIRTVQAQIGAPSLTSYAVAGDSALWFGNTESSNGPVHSNQGIRMDGASDSEISSSNLTYTPSSSLGGDGHSHPGVWCSPSVTSPVNCNTRPKTDWVYPSTSVDFNSISGDLCGMKKTAFLANSSTSALAGLSNACSQTPNTRTNAYLPQRSTSGTYSVSKGYLIELNPNGTYNLSNVNAETDTRTPYTSALTLQSVATNISMPTAGVIFAEDNVWVRSNPTFHGRVTIAAGRLAQASVNAEIVVADDLLYSTKNGADSIGLVAENSVTIAPYAPPASGSFNFEVDAAAVAQTGNVFYPDVYRSDSTSCTRGWVDPNQVFTFYGSVATRQTWTWTWLVGSHSCGDAAHDSQNGYVSGIEHNSTQYDYNAQFSPPPSFPITSTYNVLSWREILTRP
jgi:Tfp pilus assembly protein PilX